MECSMVKCDIVKKYKIGDLKMQKIIGRIYDSDFVCSLTEHNKNAALDELYSRRDGLVRNIITSHSSLKQDIDSLLSCIEDIDYIERKTAFTDGFKIGADIVAEALTWQPQ